MRASLLALLATGAVALSASTAHADTFEVDRSGDDGGAGACNALIADDCSLRSAITQANVVVASTGDHIVQLPEGTYTLASDLPETLGTLTIRGAGARSTTIDGAQVALPFKLSGGGTTLTVEDLTVRGAAGAPAPPPPGPPVTPEPSPAAISGGNGLLAVRRVAVVDNSVQGISGTYVAVEDSLVARNTGRGFGGVYGIRLLALSNTTVTQNVAGTLDPNLAFPWAIGSGVVAGCSAMIANSTIADNTVAGGISTIGADNLSVVNGGCPTGSARVRASVIGSDGTANGNCSGAVQSLGSNVSSDGTCAFVRLSDRPDAVAGLVPAADNGGPTDTRALLATSAALGLGSDCPAADQRGVARPAGGGCDAGAYESELVAPAAPAPPTPPVAPTVTVPGATVTVPRPTDTTPAKVTLAGLPKTVKRTALAKGLKLTLTSDEPVSAALTLAVAPARVTIARAYDLTVATATLRRGTGKRSVTIKPKQKLPGKKAVNARLRIVATDAGGNRTILTKTFTVI